MKLGAAILRLIEDEGNGSAVDRDLAKKVMDSFVSLGIDDTDPPKKSVIPKMEVRIKANQIGE